MKRAADLVCCVRLVHTSSTSPSWNAVGVVLERRLTLQGKQINQRDQTVTSDTFCFCFIYFSVAIDRNENIRNIEKKEKSVLEQQSSADERLEKGEKKRDNI